MAIVPRLLITTALLATGCRGSSSESAPASPKPHPDVNSDPTFAIESPPPASPKVATPPAPPKGPGPDELPRLEGQTQAALRLEFGEPTVEREFTMDECCTEFEIELYNHYPPKAGHDDVAIRESTWQFDGYKLTIWLHQHEGEWVALETSRYADGTEF